MKNLFITALFALASQAFSQELNISALSVGAGASVTTAQLPSIITSTKVYCLKVNGKNYLASKGAVSIFNKVRTSRSSAQCNDKVKRQAFAQGNEVIQLSKSKMEPKAYSTLAKALIKGFGV